VRHRVEQLGERVARRKHVQVADEGGEEHVGEQAGGNAVENRRCEEVEQVLEPVVVEVARRRGDVRVGGELRAPRVEAREGPAGQGSSSARRDGSVRECAGREEAKWVAGVG
jgi:hypothetical protein